MAMGSPTVTAGPTGSPTAPDRRFPCDQWPEPCDVLRRIEAATAAGDRATLLSMWAPIAVTCTQPLQGVDAPAKLCEGAEPGEMRDGYLLGNEARYVAMPASSVGVLPASADPATYRVTTIGCPAVQARLDCSHQFMLVFSWSDQRGVQSFTLYEFDALLSAVKARRVLLHMDGSTDVLATGGETGTHPLLPGNYDFMVAR